jgi:hypothetical protein
MKDKKVLISVVLVVLLLVGGGAYAFLGNKTQTSKQPAQASSEDEQPVLTLKPEDIGLTMQLRNDKKAVRFVIEKPEGIKAVEYQLSYTKEVDGEQLPEGLIGDAKFNPGDKQIAIEYRELGTCSKNVCRYDKVVSPVKVTLKVTKDDSKVYEVESSQDTK